MLNPKETENEKGGIQQQDKNEIERNRSERAEPTSIIMEDEQNTNKKPNIKTKSKKNHPKNTLIKSGTSKTVKKGGKKSKPAILTKGLPISFVLLRMPAPVRIRCAKVRPGHQEKKEKREKRKLKRKEKKK